MFVLSVFLCLLQFTVLKPSISNSFNKFGECYQMLNLVVYHLHGPRFTQCKFQKCNKIDFRARMQDGTLSILCLSTPFFMQREGTNPENMAASFPEPWRCDVSAEAEIKCTVSEAG